MALKMQKVPLLEVFHHTAAKTKFIEKLADMFDRFAELNADTATRPDFTKTVPTKFHL